MNQVSLKKHLCIPRDDDKVSVISNRMKEYESKTAPLLEVYKKKGIVIDFEAKRGVKDHPRLLELLQPKLK
jgi:adenylate kinase